MNVLMLRNRYIQTYRLQRDSDDGHPAIRAAWFLPVEEGLGRWPDSTEQILQQEAGPAQLTRGLRRDTRPSATAPSPDWRPGLRKLPQSFAQAAANYKHDYPLRPFGPCQVVTSVACATLGPQCQWTGQSCACASARPEPTL
jgi:hypothetical protein